MVVKSLLDGAMNDVLREVTGLHVSVYPETEVIIVRRGSKKSICIDTQTGGSAYSELGLLNNPKFQVVDGRSVVMADIGSKINTINLACLAGVTDYIISNNIKEWDCMCGLEVNHMDSCGSNNNNDRLYNLELVTATQNKVHEHVLNRLNGFFEDRHFAISAEDVETLRFIKYHTPLEVMCWLKSQYIEVDGRSYEYINLAAKKLARWKAIWAAEEQKRQAIKLNLQEERG